MPDCWLPFGIVSQVAHHDDLKGKRTMLSTQSQRTVSIRICGCDLVDNGRMKYAGTSFV